MEHKPSYQKKAELILANQIHIPQTIRLPHPFARSTAGPNSGFATIGLSFETHRIKLPITHQASTYTLHQESLGYSIYKDDDPFIEDVTLLPIKYHAPDQVFLNIQNRCIHHCAFCTIASSYKQENHIPLTEKKIMNIINKTIDNTTIKGYAVTGGVYPSQTHHIDTLLSLIKTIRQKNDTIPIGVEPTIQSMKEIQAFYEAGATEIKINMQTATEQLFHQICPDFSYQNQVKYLEKAVESFGKGKVTSNIITGLGETNDDILESIEFLLTLGVVPTIRQLRSNHMIKTHVEQIIGEPLHAPTAERLILLAKKQKQLLKKYGLTTLSFHTMCHACRCCDLVPFWDV